MLLKYVDIHIKKPKKYHRQLLPHIMNENYFEIDKYKHKP